MSESGKGNYKDTLNLPKTTFDMKANLLAKEPAFQAQWKKEDLYGQVRAARAGRKRFVLHDGPPFANGNIHIGHALNKVLKDMVIRCKTMTGFDAPYVPGWDCHGQPIEQKIVDELGAKSALALPAMEIRRRCQEYAARFAGIQSEQFQRLGVLGDWDRPYITMSPRFEADVLEVFAELVEKGIVYKQLKPVHWSIENRTALADAELEYQDREDTSVYVALPLTAETAGKTPCGGGGSKVCLMVWTTTPWTLPANLAVAVHPDFTYCCVNARTAAVPATFIIAQERVEAVISAIRAGRPGWLESYDVGGTMSGSLMVDAGLRYEHPLMEGKTCPVVGAGYVTLADGTGLVHTAPGHGLEDYGTGLKNGLEIYCPVRADGTFDDTAPAWLRGASVWDANGMITDHLSRCGLLMLEEKIVHSYPHDWRSKTPTIFRATEQWFIAVDRPLGGGRQTLREMAMEACRRGVKDGGVEFVPAWGRSRIAGMLESRPDWCISRQRSWGLPIPAFYNKAGRPLLTAASVRAVAAVFAENGSDAWFALPPRELLRGYDPRTDAALDDPGEFAIDGLTRGADIFDVWFESGSTWFAVCVRRELVDDIPVDMYLEGSDQHRGWFQLSLLPALAVRGTAPFKTVLTHGWVMDERGYKMSKSVGNTVDVIEQLAKRGADILRLWVSSQNYHDDVRGSEGLIAQTEDAYRKIRNTFRYCIGACCDFDPARHAATAADHSVDQWMKMELHRLIRDVRQAYDEYEFHKAARLLYEFCTVQASSIYFSAVKDRLYCEAPDSPRRRATQTVIHEMLMALVKLLAPIIPHTCQEAWEHIPFRDPAEPANVHLAMMDDYDAEVLRLADDLRPVTPDLARFAADKLQAGPAWTWTRLLELRDAGLIKLEALRNAGVKNPLDVEAVFKVARGADPVAGMVEAYLRELEDLLGVGHARMERVAQEGLPAGTMVDVEVLDSRGKYQALRQELEARRPDVGSDPEYPDLSARDAMVMRQLKGE